MKISEPVVGTQAHKTGRDLPFLPNFRVFGIDMDNHTE